MQVMDMLERLYHKLDDVAHEFKVFKVETIGDSYMAVANLIEPQPDHAARIADFAMEVLPPPPPFNAQCTSASSSLRVSTPGLEHGVRGMNPRSLRGQFLVSRLLSSLLGLCMCRRYPWRPLPWLTLRTLPAGT